MDNRKLTDEQARQAYQLVVHKRWTYERVAKKFGVVRSVIGGLCRRETYGHLNLPKYINPGTKPKPVSKVCTECGKLVVNVGSGIAPSKFLRSKRCKSCAREPVKGERSGRAKLTEKEVREIHQRVKNGESQARLAEQFNVNWPSVNAICRGTTWKYLGLKPLDPLLHGTAKLTEKDVREIYKRAKNGEPRTKLAEQFNVSRETVSNICGGRNWKRLGLKPLDPPPHGRSKLTEKEVREIYQRAKGGEPRARLAREFNVNWPSVNAICKGTTWKYLGLKPLNLLLHGTAKLTEKDVREIYKRAKGRESIARLAEQFNVSRNTVGSICRGVTWKHLGLEPLNLLPYGRFRLTEKDVREIHKTAKGRESLARLAEQFNVSRETVRNVCNGATWKHLGLKPLSPSHGRSKLTEKEVRKIHQRVKGGESQTKLAKQLNISRQTVSNICGGRNWKRLGLEPLRLRRKKRANQDRPAAN